MRVYPRAYGETLATATPPLPAMGLSPRIRGNPPLPRLGRRRAGSIPAHTGKPGRPPASAPSPGVYPRAYGETVGQAAADYDVTGLSPRIRGNHQQQRAVAPRRGSIPAHTGKPVWLLLSPV